MPEIARRYRNAILFFIGGTTILFAGLGTVALISFSKHGNPATMTVIGGMIALAFNQFLSKLDSRLQAIEQMQTVAKVEKTAEEIKSVVTPPPGVPMPRNAEELDAFVRKFAVALCGEMATARAEDYERFKKEFLGMLRVEAPCAGVLVQKIKETSP